MVGGWSFRKGCDLIVEALKDTNLTFLHVGGIVDVEFPSFPNFTHVDAVDQSKVIDYYHKVYAGDAINNLTWEAYGKRYADFFIQITSNK